LSTKDRHRQCLSPLSNILLIKTVFDSILLASVVVGKGGKNRRRGKGDGEESKRELEFKEDGTSRDRRQRKETTKHAHIY
jgi:hypothetical protein